MKLLTILTVFAGVFGTLFGLYFAVIAAAGLLRKKKEIPHHDAQKRIAVLIPARNEEGVIPYLVESVLRQDYPRSLFEVIAVPNNCTDGTAMAAEKAGARVLRIEKNVHSKAEALNYVFQTLDNEGFDAYVIVDADNLLDKAFLQSVNDALCEGYEAGQSRRESKNLYGNWVSFCSSMIFAFSNVLINRARFSLGMSAVLNGTGVILSRDLVRRTGFDMRCMTEDMEYTDCCALQGIPIAYIENAITYDEQPVSLRDSYRQRCRWGYGMYQCFKGYCAKLLRKAIKEKNIVCLDCAMNCSIFLTQAVALIPLVCTIILLARGVVTSGAWLPVLGALAGSILSMVLSGVPAVVLICLLSRIPLKKAFPHMLFMGFFLLTYLPANLLPLLGKTPKWVPIPHVEKATIHDMTGE